jgi:membrane protease YdiL (CAAX protease family)
MRTLIPLLLLMLVLAFFWPAIPARLRERLLARPRLLFLAPVSLAAFFCAVVASFGVLSLPLVLLILTYTFLPTICAFVQCPQPGAASWLDFAIMLMLWLPIELNVGRPWIPREIQGLAHTAVYGIGLLLALVLLGAFRGLCGMKYNLPRQWRDALYVLAAFAAAALILIPLGLALSFLAPVHALKFSGGTLAWRFLGIWAGTALPEEILFRALIQNWIMQKFGESNWTLLAAAVIFGCSHLNNGPGALPNWRYAILATIAGWLYGKVFQKASSIVASATLHAMVNTVRHGFF